MKEKKESTITELIMKISDINTMKKIQAFIQRDKQRKQEKAK